MDELESWPPASFSSAPLPRSVRRIVPRRGYVISCFVWTCRLAKVVEEVLDLEFVETTGENEWDRQFRESGEARRGLLSEAQEAERISEQLRLWREMLPRNLQIDDTLSPMPHHAISLAVRTVLWLVPGVRADQQWHTTSTIMLHSRYVTNIPRALPQPTSPATREAGEIVANSHDICSAAAASTVDMMRMLDKYGLMEQLSSDIIHILSLVTLFLGRLPLHLSGFYSIRIHSMRTAVEIIGHSGESDIQHSTLPAPPPISPHGPNGTSNSPAPGYALSRPHGPPRRHTNSSSKPSLKAA